jgi:hypothetical protein
MIKGNYGPRLIRGIVHLFLRHGNNRVRYAHDIGGISAGGMQKISIGGAVANYAFGIMAPFAVATETLTMIRALKTWLSKVGWIGLTAVTFAARGNMPWRAVMMTGLASLIHTGHLRMKLMIEMYRAVLVHEFIEEHRIGRLAYSMLA